MNIQIPAVLPSQLLHKKVAIIHNEQPVLITIRWQGRLTEKNKDIWYGVEFDDDLSGTHNGSFREQRFFNTFYRGESGSFMKKLKVDELIEHGGVSFVGLFEAMQENYPDFFTDGDRVYQMDTVQFGNKTVESVGIGYRKKMLHAINFRNCMLDGGDFEIPDTFDSAWAASVKEIDLSQNMITNFEFVNNVVGKLFPKVWGLNLTGNYFDLDFTARNFDFSLISLTSLDQITRLTFDSNGLNSQKLINLLKIFKNLKTLFIQGNFIEDVGTGCGKGASDCCEKFAPGSFKPYGSLETLHLSFSPSFKKIPSYLPALFPNLDSLQVNVCPLGNDFLPEGCVFENLTNFSLIKSGVTEIQVFDKLAVSFPKMTHLATSENIFTEYPNMTSEDPTIRGPAIATIRQIAIAKIPTLKNLNRSDNLPRERMEAEIDYLKRFAKSEERDTVHPQYERLEKKHGKVSAEELNYVKKKNVEIKLQHMGKEIVKKVPLSMTVQKLKLLFKKLYKLREVEDLVLETEIETHEYEGDHVIKLYGDEENHEDKNRYDQQNIGYFSPNDGDCVSTREHWEYMKEIEADHQAQQDKMKTFPSRNK